MADFNLFRGQLIGAKLARNASSLKLTLDIEDYNRLWEKSLVGAPDGSWVLQQDDGAYVPYDALATNTGATDADVFTYLVETYWVGPTLNLTNHVKAFRTQNDTVSWGTALSDLSGILDEWAARTSAAIRYWVDADLDAHWWALGPTEWAYNEATMEEVFAGGFTAQDQADIVPSPFAIDNDQGTVWDGGSGGPDASVLPMSLDVSWDWAAILDGVYVKGGTIAPEGSWWVYTRGLGAGYGYVDAPGSILNADAVAIALWHLNQEFRELLTGSATIPIGYDGWRVGQSVAISDEVFSRFTGRELDAQSFVIQRVTGRLMAPGDGLHITIGGTDYTDQIVNWSSFNFEETLGSAGKATATLEVMDGTIALAELADVRIWTDGSAALEYDIEFGDIPAGPLPREAAVQPGDQPANRFIVTVQDEHIPVGSDTLVTAQLCTAAGVPLAIANVYLEWVLLQWAYEGAGDVDFWMAAVHKMEGYIAVYQAILDGGGTLTPRQQAAMDADEVTLAHNQEHLDAALAGSTTEVAFWAAAVDKMQGYVDVYQAIIDGGGTLTTKQQAAMDTDTATLAYNQEQLAAAEAAAGGGPLTAGTGYSLADVSGITDATGRAFTRLSHDEAGTTVQLEVQAVALPI